MAVFAQQWVVLFGHHPFPRFSHLNRVFFPKQQNWMRAVFAQDSQTLISQGELLRWSQKDS